MMNYLFELYIRLMVWLGAEPPPKYEHLDKEEFRKARVSQSPPAQKDKPQAAPPKPTKPETTPAVVAETSPAVAEVTPETQPPPPVDEVPVSPVADVLPEPQTLAPVTEAPVSPVAEPPSEKLEPPPSFEADEPEPEPPIEAEDLEPVAKPTLEFDSDFPPIGSMEAVRALYLSYEALGDEEQRQRVLALLDKAEFNAVVIDVKNERGLISYPSQVPIAQEIGAVQPNMDSFSDFLRQLKQNHVYTIAQLVVFKDNLFAQNFPEYAVKVKNSATLWQDSDQQSWADPFLGRAWGYNHQLAVEAAKLGFDEILFDTLRFPRPSQAGEPEFSQELNQSSRLAAISSFLSAARGQLDPFNVKLSATIFGYASWRKDDGLIGQNLERLAQHVDVLCPTLYPSTFKHGIPKYKNAVAHPYEIVQQSTARAVKRVDEFGCQIRPWLQDFPDYAFDKRGYGKDEIQAQIKGCFDGQAAGFMVWNPQTDYTAEAYAPVSRLVAA